MPSKQVLAVKKHWETMASAMAERPTLEETRDRIETQEMLHTFQMAAGNAPEADEAIRRAAEWMRPRLGL